MSCSPISDAQTALRTAESRGEWLGMRKRGEGGVSEEKQNIARGNGRYLSTQTHDGHAVLL